LLRYGIKVHFGTVLSESDYKLDIYFILFFLSAYDLGIYSISLAICSLAIYIPNSITTILFPYTSESKKRNKNFTFFFLSGLTIFQIVFIIFLVLTGESLINFFYGSDFIGSYQILLFLLPGIFFDSLTRILINYYKSNNTMLLPNFFAIFTVIINVSLLFYLLPLYGLIGAAISTSITYALKFLLLLFSLAFLKKITRMFQH
jgi:O-antigen/teichoic acid export membrane protein